jgi:hypothetical protein
MRVGSESCRKHRTPRACRNELIVGFDRLYAVLFTAKESVSFSGSPDGSNAGNSNFIGGTITGAGHSGMRWSGLYKNNVLTLDENILLF